MKPEAGAAPRCDHRSALRIEAAADFSAVRAATLKVREWLAEKGLGEEDLGSWELALVEAVNNAVKYASVEARQQPVIIEVSAGNNDIEVRVTDHTAGFEWPAEVKAPAFEAESGRGLFLMKSLTDSVIYLRQAGENVLVMRRARPAGASESRPDVSRLQARLGETEVLLTEMTSELASSYESLVALFRYSAELGTQSDLQDFSRRLLRDLVQITEADFAVLRLVSPDGKRLETMLAWPESGRTRGLTAGNRWPRTIPCAR